jgi:hypothetical protein
LNYLKLDWISLLQGAIPFTDNGGIMYEYVWSIFPPDKAVSFGIIEPLYGSLHFDQPPDPNFEISHRGA